jgi:Flp pilus assembly protein TadG
MRRASYVIRKKCERGASLILFAILTMFLILPMVGLAIDGSIQYWMKARLSAAIDSCALATARAFNVGQDFTTQANNAVTIGNQYFAANFPAGMMGVSIVNGKPSITPTMDQFTKTITVKVTASATVPLYFMRIIGFSSSTIGASGQATRRALNLVLVLDRSGSMQTAKVCGTMISAAQGFMANWAENRDQVGLVTFQTTAKTDLPTNTIFKTEINNALASLKCAGSTNSAQGLYLAYLQIKKANEPTAMNVIVFFTDGQPNSFQGTLPVRTSKDARYQIGHETGGNAPTTTVNPTCVASDNLSGVITGSSVDVEGIYDPTPVAISTSTTKLIGATGCYFSSGIKNAAEYVPYDIQFIPSVLSPSGISTIGYKGYKPLVYYSNDDPIAAQAGQIRPDEYLNAQNAGINAADNIARTIRDDTNYNTIIYSIGLGGTTQTPIDFDFLERVANDARSSTYDSNEATGEFVYASDAGALGAAFNQIASQILRLAQ